LDLAFKVVIFLAAERVVNDAVDNGGEDTKAVVVVVVLPRIWRLTERIALRVTTIMLSVAFSSLLVATTIQFCATDPRN